MIHGVALTVSLSKYIYSMCSIHPNLCPFMQRNATCSISLLSVIRYFPKDKSGWQKDGISKGSYIVTRDAAGEYDIIFTDALNRTVSSREDGGSIIVVSQSDSHLILVINYPEMNIETWYFNIGQRGVGESNGISGQVRE